MAGTIFGKIYSTSIFFLFHRGGKGNSEKLNNLVMVKYLDRLYPFHFIPVSSLVTISLRYLH